MNSPRTANERARRVLVSVVLATMTACPCPGQEHAVPEHSTPDHRALAIAAASLVNDLNIHSLRWKQRVEEEDTVTGQWRPMQEGEFAWNDTGAWAARTTTHVRSSDGGPMPELRVSLATREGVVQTSYLPDAANGSIQPVEMSAWWVPSPVLCLGRMVGWVRAARLCELLLESKDLRVVSESEGGRRVAVDGTIETGGMVGCIRVEFDNDDGYVPRRWEFRDALSGIPLESVEITQVARVRGCVIPTRAVRRTYGMDEGVNPTLLNRVDEEVRRAGIDPAHRDPRDASVRAVYAAAREQVFGPAGLPYRQHGGAQRLAEVSDLRVNESIPDDEFEITFPPGTTWADLIRFTDSQGRPIDDPDEPSRRKP